LVVVDMLDNDLSDGAATDELILNAMIRNLLSIEAA